MTLFDTSFVLWVLAIVLIVIGLVGIVVPAVPGVLAVFAGLLLAAWADNFVKVGWITLTVLALLALLSVAIDFFVTSFGAKRVGASKLAIAGAAIGTLVGIFFGIIGLFVGPFVGAFVCEYIVRKDMKQAGKAGAGTWLAIVLGTAAKIALVFTMIGIFILAYII